MALSWFRRSPRDDARQPPDREPETQSTAPAGRAVVRGLLLLNLQPTDGLERIETAPPLGTREAVISAVKAVVRGIEFDSRGRGVLLARHHHVMIDLGPEDPVYAAVAAAEGHAGVEMLRAVVHQQGWRIYAPRAGVFIPPDSLEAIAEPDAAGSPS